VSSRQIRSERAPGHLPNIEKSWYVYFDGLCEPKNPGGVATFGLVVKRHGKVVFQQADLAYAKPWTNEASNNVAEYSAVIRALEWLKSEKLQSSCIALIGDSRLIINQLNGTFKVKAVRIVELHLRAMKLLFEFKDIHLQWVDRSKNKEADLLSRLAYARFMKRSEDPMHTSSSAQAMNE
jgi:ribonuclease HI